jgi:DNA replication regulator DPB11
MSDVTVLIVGDRDTDKFKFSVRNRSDVKFIRPEAILEIHKRWINNEDHKDPDALSLDRFTLPIFHGFKVCLSRINTDKHFNTEDRDELIRLIRDCGGDVSDSLTGSSACVITNEKSGKRYTMAKKWKIPNVHPLWVLHCVKRKAALEFDYYNIDKVQEDSIGEGSCTVWDDLKKRKRKRILAEEEEQIKKKPEFWNDILNEAKKQVASAKKKDKDVWDDKGHETEREKIDVIIQPAKKPSFTQQNVISKLFQGKSFKLEFFDDDKTATLVRTIQSHSGKIMTDSSPSYIIIPSDFPTLNIPQLFYESADTQIMTEFFIERCLHYKDLKEGIWGKPFYQPLLDPPDLSICITGFQGIELLHVTKMISLSGFKFCDFLTKDRDILIVNYDLLRAKSGEHLTKKYPSLFDESFKKKATQTSIQSTRNKLNFSRKNSIPILTITFLFESFYNGMVFNINSKDCCIYCPKLAHLKDNLRSLTMSDTERQTDLRRSDSSSSLPKLPSPIRNKRQDKWGRLIGRAPESEFKKNLHDTLSNDDFQDDENHLKSTQIGYAGIEGSDSLLSMLNSDSGTLNEQIRPRSALTKARRTRQGYKDMLDILDT